MSDENVWWWWRAAKGASWGDTELSSLLPFSGWPKSHHRAPFWDGVAAQLFGFHSWAGAGTEHTQSLQWEAAAPWDVLQCFSRKEKAVPRLMRLKFLNVCCRHADFPAPHAPGPALFPVPARVPHRVCLDCHGEGSPGQRVPGGAARDTQDSPEASWLPRVAGRVSMEGLGRACRKGMCLGRTHCGGRGGCAGQSWGFQWFFFFFLFMQILALIWERVSWVTSVRVTWVDLPLFLPSPWKCPMCHGMTA